MVFALKGYAGSARDGEAGAGFALEDSESLVFGVELTFWGQGMEVIDDGLEYVYGQSHGLA